LFQIMFSMGMPQVTPPKKRLGIEIEHLPHEGTTAKHDLCLYAEESYGELFFGIEYKDDLFDRATIEGMASSYRTLLTQLVSAPEAPLSQVSLLDAGDASQLASWSRGDEGAIEAACLHEQFEHQAERQPDALAVVCEGQRLTYAELNARANRLARHLRAHGVGAEARVVLCLERSLELAVAILAVWKAGAAYVPLDPAYPPGRVSEILEDADAAWVLSEHALQARFADGRAQVWALDDASFDQSLQGHSADDLDRGEAARTPSNLAYVIFTSGSTGRPKGVMVEHRSAVNLGQALRERLASIGVPGACRWAWNASVSFDASVQALTQWASGACLHVLPEAVRRDPDALLAYLKAQQIDVLDTTPLQADVLLNAHAAQAPDTSLPVLVIGGEAIGAPLWDRLAAHYAGSERRALNVYGPTEATVDATSAWIEPGPPTIGRPLANVRCHVLDRHGQVQPVGALGELHIGGAGVARGYLDRAQLNAERFIEIEVDGARERVYRTGDLVRWRPTGDLAFIGRADGQVKIRGYRVELGEIEQRLRAIEGIGAVAVTVRGEEATRELVAYVVHAATPAGDWAESLRQALRVSLPAYMLPAHFVAIDALPMTTSGKLDVAALPVPARIATDVVLIPAATPTESKLLDLWADLFGIEAKVMGVGANFFSLGGHSMLLMRLMSGIRAAFNVQPPLQALFDVADLRGMATLIDACETLAATDVLEEVEW
jgi:amino acid adenylation domain-containing protein